MLFVARVLHWCVFTTRHQLSALEIIYGTKIVHIHPESATHPVIHSWHDTCF